MTKKTVATTQDTSPSRFVLSGKLFYGHLHPDFPDTAYTPRWGMALSMEEDMQELALDNPYVSLHKNVRNAKGEENQAPIVVDAKKHRVSDDILGSIGWGSDVKVLVSRFFMSKWNKWGFSIDKVQIIKVSDTSQHRKEHSKNH